MNTVKRTERGWPGHFICADRCQFRRNTLLECGEIRLVVSSVGGMRRFWEDTAKYETIGLDRDYETMVFHAQWDDPYWDVDVTQQVYFESPWTLLGVKFTSDAQANDMHENVVDEMTRKLLAGEIKPALNEEENL